MACRRLMLVGFWLCLWLALTGLSRCSPAVSADDDSLRQLLNIYHAYELPSPPDSAELSIIKPEGDNEYALAFVEKKPDIYFFWNGCERVPLSTSYHCQSCAPNLNSFSQTVPLEKINECDGFRSFADVALAMQCEERGWHELGDAIWKRAKSHFSRNRLDRTPRDPRNVREALFFLAWNHWCNEFAISRSDRQPITGDCRRNLRFQP